MSTEKQLTDAPDEVYPLYPLDNEKTNRCFVSWLMRFNDVLDPEQLNNALLQLLEIGDWKKLGGRLRLKVRFPSEFNIEQLVVEPHPNLQLGEWRPRSPCPK